MAITRKERLCLTPVQSFESNVCAMRYKKNYFGDPSWKTHFDKIHEMQVLKALCVKKRATPSRGASLVVPLAFSFHTIHLHRDNLVIPRY